MNDFESIEHSLCVGFFVVTVAVLVYYAHAFSSFADWPKGLSMS